MNYLALAVAGIVGTALMTMVMIMAPKMGMPKMDVPGMLAGMLGGNKGVGMMMHFVMGILFAFAYTFLPTFADNIWLNAVVLGFVHWLVVGALMGIMPKMMSAMPDSGFYMMGNGGMMAFMGGAIGHIVFALGVTLSLSLYA